MRGSLQTDINKDKEPTLTKTKISMQVNSININQSAMEDIFHKMVFFFFLYLTVNLYKERPLKEPPIVLLLITIIIYNNYKSKYNNSFIFLQKS